jgi:tRNA nucleotidyltransferase (CCA-adding enzyme)
MASDIERLTAAVPEAVRAICARLRKAGFEAFTVGGAVRDALLGRHPGDWDVTTSARPEEVQKLFLRTIPTGLPHGTVTVLEGRGAARTAVEVTTFRGEGAYSDARRPDSVIFGVPLEEDLARRDFVVNAIAFDPIDNTLRDPFGGAADIARRVLRAVGDPAARFAEDGLRVMRAVRFAATLEFSLDPATEEAILAALPSLARVSQERVRVELFKLLAATQPTAALKIALQRGVLNLILPELDTIGWPRALASLVVAPADPPLRLGVLFSALGRPELAETAMRRLTLSNPDRGRVVALARLGPRFATASPDDAELRRLLGEAGRDQSAPDLIALWCADGRAELAARAQRLLQSGDPLTVGELAISGKELIDALGMAPGPEVGRVLRSLLDAALEDPALNTRDALLARAQDLCRRESD